MFDTYFSIQDALIAVGFVLSFAIGVLVGILSP